MNAILVNLIHSGKTIAMRPSMPVAGSNKGAALVLYARPGVKFQLIDEHTGAPPTRVVANRIRKRLELSLGAGEDPVLVIENYFVIENSNDSIVGEVNGVLKSYFPERPVGIDIGEFNCDVPLILQDSPLGLQISNLPATSPQSSFSFGGIAAALGISALASGGGHGDASTSSHPASGAENSPVVTTNETASPSDSVIDRLDDPHIHQELVDGHILLQLIGSGMTLDLTRVDVAPIRMSEIDITGSGNNVLKLNVTAMLQLAESATSTEGVVASTLVVDGDMGDTVNLSDISAWTNSQTQIFQDGHVYSEWTNARFHLLIDEHVAVS